MIVARGAVAIVLVASVLTAARADETIGPGAIGASVRDASDRAVVGAIVRVEGPIAREATTTQGGVVTLDALPLGTYMLRVVRAGYQPYAKDVTLGGSGRGIALLNLRLVPARFADRRDVAMGSMWPGGDVAIAVADAIADASRVELDGIALPGDAALYAALRTRSKVGLADVDIARGQATLNFRTPELDAPLGGIGAIGYDSAIGSFGNVGANERIGGLAVLADVASGAMLRSQTIKIDASLSRALSVGFASDRMQTLPPNGALGSSVDARVSAVDLRADVGTTTFSARTFASDARVAVADGRPSLERARGMQATWAVLFGDDLLSLGYERIVERDASFDRTVPSRVSGTLSVRTDVRLAPTVRLALGDAYARGPSLSPRHDPYAAIAFQTDPRTIVRLSAGSAYATAPLESRALSDDPTSLARPETTVGVRLQAERARADGTRAWFALDDQRRFERFAPRADARALGFEIGYVRPPASEHVDASIALRYAPARAAIGTTPGGLASSEARVTLGYSDATSSVGVGFTEIGANGAFSTRAIALGDARLRVLFAGALELRVGIDNLFGYVAMDPRLAPLFVPHELTLTFGPARAR